MSVESKSLGVCLGPFIPIEPYDKVAAAIWARFPSMSSNASPHAVAASVGWTGLGYRARSASEHKTAFSSLFDLEPAATPEQRYQQDNHFFGFVTNIAAAAESLVFSVHAVALGIDGQELTDQLLKRQRGAMVSAVCRVDQLKDLGSSLQKSLDLATSLFDMRDMLLHRGRPPRNHFVGGEYDGKITLATNPKASPEKWTNRFVFDAGSCEPDARWLNTLICDSIASLERILLPPPRSA